MMTHQHDPTNCGAYLAAAQPTEIIGARGAKRQPYPRRAARIRRTCPHVHCSRFHRCRS